MKIVDLTMPLGEKTPVFPGDPGFMARSVATIEHDGWNTSDFEFSSHLATHIDAPIHMIAGGKTLSDFPIEKFVGSAIVIDVRGQKTIEADLSAVKESDIVFFQTDWTKKSGTAAFFKNHPTLSLKTAQQVVQKKAKIIGMDLPTPDNEPYAIHKLLLGHEILIVENLVNLDALESERFDCVIAPLFVVGADGAPCRVIGITK